MLEELIANNVDLHARKIVIIALPYASVWEKIHISEQIKAPRRTLIS